MSREMKRNYSALTEQKWKILITMGAHNNGPLEFVLVVMICKAAWLDFFVLAFFSGKMRSFWGLEPSWAHVQHTLFYGVWSIQFAAFWLMVFFWVYLVASLHVMPVATGKHWGQNTTYRKPLVEILWHIFSAICVPYAKSTGKYVKDLEHQIPPT